MRRILPPLPQDSIDCVKQVLEREEEKETAAENGERFSGEGKNGKEKSDKESNAYEDNDDVPMNLNHPE
jgi:hypothetical protein